MRRTFLLAGLVLALGVFLPASTQAAVGGTDLPFKATASGYSDITVATGETHSVTSGTASHFGLSTVVAASQVFPTGPGTIGLVGTWTATGANGDSMTGTQTGTASTTDGVHYVWQIHWDSIGGTGRFANATLTADWTMLSTRGPIVGGVSRAIVEIAGGGRLSYR